MQQLLETIRCVDGKPQNLVWHQQRFNQARLQLFDAEQQLDLSTLFRRAPPKGIYRCRVLYRQQIEQVEFIPHQIPRFKSFRLITADDIDYSFKYADRTEINLLSAQKQQADDIIILKNQLVTDSSMANLACWDGQHWLTPEKPLLQGTTRARLLAVREIIPAHIYATDIKKFKKMALLNALLGFYIIEYPEFV